MHISAAASVFYSSNIDRTSVILSAFIAASRVFVSGAVSITVIAVTSVTLANLPSLDFFGGIPLFRVIQWTLAIVSVDSQLCVASVSVALLSAIVIMADLPQANTD